MKSCVKNIIVIIILSFSLFAFVGCDRTKYEINFNSNGGTEVKPLFYNGKNVELPVPERDGFIFDGWYLDDSLETKFDTSSEITDGLELYAKWISLAYMETKDTILSLKNIKTLDGYKDSLNMINALTIVEERDELLIFLEEIKTEDTQFSSAIDALMIVDEIDDEESFVNANKQVEGLDDTIFKWQLISKLKNLENENPKYDEALNISNQIESISDPKTFFDAYDLVEKLSNEDFKNNLIEELNEIKANNPSILKAYQAKEAINNIDNLEDLFNACMLVSKLPDDRYTDFLNVEISNIIKQNQLYKDVEEMVEVYNKAKSTKTLNDIDDAINTINSYKDPEDNGFLERLVNELIDLKKEEMIHQANLAVDMALEVKTRINLDAARTLVDNLDDLKEKQRLQSILDDILSVINATEAVNKAMETKLSEDYNDAFDLIESLKDGSDKNNLRNRLANIEDIINSNLLLLEAISAVETLESNRCNDNIDIAEGKVLLLETGDMKRALENRINIVKAKIELEKAEESSTQSDVNNAKQLIKDVLNLYGIDNKTPLLNRLIVVQNEIDKKASDLVDSAEKTFFKEDYIKANNYISQLNECALKTDLMSRLTVVENKLNEDLTVKFKNEFNVNNYLEIEFNKPVLFDNTYLKTINVNTVDEKRIFLDYLFRTELDLSNIDLNKVDIELTDRSIKIVFLDDSFNSISFNSLDSADKNGILKYSININVDKFIDEYEKTVNEIDEVYIKFSVTFVHGMPTYDDTIKVNFQTLNQSNEENEPKFDDVAPLLEKITPRSSLFINDNDSIKIVIDVFDENLNKIIINNIVDEDLVLYADTDNPYKDNEQLFINYGITATYNEDNKIWTIDLGTTITNDIVEKGKITFYYTILDYVGNAFGSITNPVQESTNTIEVKKYTEVLSYEELLVALNNQYISKIYIKDNLVLDKRLEIRRPVIIDCENKVISFSQDLDEDNASKHSIYISSNDVIINNLKLDASNYSYGINAYLSQNVEINDTEIINSKGVGLTINGSSVKSNNLVIKNSGWKSSINVDPGFNVLEPSRLILTGDSSLEDELQIYSDGKYVSDQATVEVDALGYNDYIVKSSINEVNMWTNKEITGCSFIESKPKVVYFNLQDALVNTNVDDVVIIKGQIGSEDDYKIYNINVEGIKIKGDGNSTIYGTFNIMTERVTIEGLNIYNQGLSGDDVLYETVITVKANNFTLTNTKLYLKNNTIGIDLTSEIGTETNYIIEHNDFINNEIIENKVIYAFELHGINSYIINNFDITNYKSNDIKLVTEN